MKKNDYKLNFRKFAVAVYLWSWRHWWQLVNKHRCSSSLYDNSHQRI